MLSRKYKVCIAGHCKATADRILRDAEQIASRLANREKVKALAEEYGCDAATLAKHITAVIGPLRWRQLVYRRGPRKGRGVRGPRPIQDALPADNGPQCWYCSKSILPTTRVCAYCGTLQQG